MANTLMLTGPSGGAFYVVIRDEDGDVWNGSSFETYGTSPWTSYDVALAEQGASSMYVGTFPTVASGDYAVAVHKDEDEVGGVPNSPIEADYVVGNMLVSWDGSTIIDLQDCSATTTAAAILVTPANLLTTDGSGDVTVENTSAIGTAVWATGTRTLTSFGTVVADVATAVWAAATRTLTAFSFDTNNATLEGRLTATRAANLDDLDVASSTLATAANLALVKTATDKMEDTLEDDGGTYRFTANALEEGPDSTSDATLAKQDAIIAAVGALTDVTASEVATAVLGATVDGSVDVEEALKVLFAVQHGRMVRTATDPLTFDLYDAADTTVVLTWTIPTTGATRTTS